MRTPEEWNRWACQLHSGVAPRSGPESSALGAAMQHERMCNCCWGLASWPRVERLGRAHLSSGCTTVSNKGEGAHIGRHRPRHHVYDAEAVSARLSPI
eukprot:scaffold26437_cov120-Isochrysis_galbana.AAC.1